LHLNTECEYWLFPQHNRALAHFRLLEAMRFADRSSEPGLLKLFTTIDSVALSSHQGDFAHDHDVPSFHDPNHQGDLL
jgi:hypothetical protein